MLSLSEDYPTQLDAEDLFEEPILFVEQCVSQPVSVRSAYGSEGTIPVNHPPLPVILLSAFCNSSSGTEGVKMKACQFGDSLIREASS
jgi:hypothetical protein